MSNIKSKAKRGGREDDEIDSLESGRGGGKRRRRDKPVQATVPKTQRQRPIHERYKKVADETLDSFMKKKRKTKK